MWETVILSAAKDLKLRKTTTELGQATDCPGCLPQLRQPTAHLRFFVAPLLRMTERGCEAFASTPNQYTASVHLSVLPYGQSTSP